MSFNKVFLLATTVLAVAAVSSAALAQGVKEQRSPAPTELMESQGGTVDAMTEISVTPAMNISLDTLGLYDDKSGGLAFSVWEGSDHARVRLLLGNLPHTIPSPTVRRLVAKLLLSTTRPPQSQTIQQNVFQQRIETLMHINEVPQALRLVETVPQDLQSERTERLRFTAHMLNGDAGWVCDNISDALGKYAGESGFWQKYSIFCLARQQDVAKTQLAVDLLSEQNITLDAGFLSLVEVMLERADEVENRFKAPLALDDAAIIALSGKDAFPKDYLKTAPLPVARLVQGNAEFADYIRDEAATRLAAAIAVEKPSKERVVMQDWFRKQFALSPESSFNFDRALAEAQSKGKSAGALRDTRRRYRFYTMLQALGFSDITASVQWADATFKDSGRTHVSPILRSEMATAVDKELTGESILLLAMAAGQVDDLSDVDDASIADMVQALMQLGYSEEAQALAAEAMTALY